MRILVTGGCGYIGSHTVLALRERGFEVTVIDDLSSGFADAVATDVELVVGDIGDQNLLEQVFSQHKFDGLIHFAGSISVPESVALPLRYYRNNTASTINLLEAAHNAGVDKVIFSSTAAVYGEQASKVSEETPVAPTNPYGRSKLMDEWILWDLAAASNMRHVILRYFNVAGADPNGRLGQRTPNATHLIKVASQVAVGKRPHLSVYGDDYDTPDGTCIRDYIHVSDLADAHVCALNYLVNAGKSVTLNCGYGHGFSVLQVIASLEKVIAKSLPKNMAPRRPGDVSRLVAETAKIRELLAWSPRYEDLEVIVKSAVEWEAKL